MNIQPNNTIFNNTDPSIVELPNASLYEYENPIYGSGNNRTLRTFLQNSSEASGVNSFNISSDSNDEFLNKGQYNLTFDKSFNTTYTSYSRRMISRKNNRKTIINEAILHTFTQTCTYF